jgi:tRNA(fMet)-specific endonuclease VapC
VNYLLDTNACIAIINGRPAGVRERFYKATNGGAAMAVSSVVVFELWYGVFKSQRQSFNAERLRVFRAGPIDLLDFDDEDGRIAGMVRSNLQAAGTPIGAYDLLIAAQALRHQTPLITSNVAEFACVSGLTFEDWATTPTAHH